MQRSCSSCIFYTVQKWYYTTFSFPITYITTGEIGLSDLLTELHDVVGWFLLGIHLGIPLSDLQKIRHQFGDSVDECKTEMLITYSKLKEPEWSDIVEALKRSGEQALALRIAQKYGKN